MYDSRARNLVNSTASGLNKIKNTIQVGSDIANFMTSKENNIGINNVCFQDSLDNAERSLGESLFISNTKLKNDKNLAFFLITL